MQKNTAEIAFAYLRKNPLLHLDMLYPLERNTAQILYAGGDGVFLQDTKSDVYMLSVEDPEIGESLLAQIDDTTLFNLHQPYLVDMVAPRFSAPNILPCNQAAYLQKDPLPIAKDIYIAVLTMEHAKEVFAHYHVPIDLPYIEQRIAEGALFGGFLDDILIGFVGTHAEGCMGLLEVLPPYRGRGYGKALESHLINHLLREGRVPFAQIGVNNAPSQALQRSLGLTISKEILYMVF